MTAAPKTEPRVSNRKVQRLPSIQAPQIGREGRVPITFDPGNPDRVLIGGNTLNLIEGTLTL